MRILIEGIGGVGGVLAARIIAARHRPLLITGNPIIAQAMNAHGLRAITPEGDIGVPAKALMSLDDVDKQNRMERIWTIYSRRKGPWVSMILWSETWQVKKRYR